MSATSVHKGLVTPELPENSYDAHNYVANDGGFAPRAGLRSGLISLTGWRRQILETFVFLVMIAVLQRRWSGVDRGPEHKSNSPLAIFRALMSSIRIGEAFATLLDKARRQLAAWRT